MENTTTYFNNKFIDEKIVPQRLCDFGTDTNYKLTNNNSGGQFTAVIAEIATAVSDLQDEINNEDTAVNTQKGTTLTVDNVMAAFKTKMGSTDEGAEPLISRALGGKISVGYLAFYPHKLGEYGDARKEEMTTLTSRVYTAATTYATQLGTTLSDELKAYKQQWTDARNDQQEQINTVGSTRDTRSEKRIVLELALMKALGLATATFPGDAEKCKTLFDFSKLYAAHHQHVYNVFLEPNETLMAFEHRFYDDNIIKLSFTNTVEIRSFLSDSSTSPSGAGVATQGPATDSEINVNSYSVNLETNKYFFLVNNSSETVEVKVEI